MSKKIFLFCLGLLLLSGCGALKKQTPQPTQTQVTVVQDLNKVINDLDGLQKSQDDVADSALVTN